MKNTKTIRGKMSTLTIQYIAGFFDGEGSINIYQTKKGVKKDRIGYQLSIYVHNTNEKIIRIFEKKFGGYVNIRKRETNKWKTGYDWKLSANQALKFLQDLIPFLILKKEQAKVAIEMQELQKSKQHQFAKTDKVVEDFYELCYQKMRLLNKKGVNTYYPQRLNEETLKRDAIVRTALKNAEIGRNDLSTLQENARKGGDAILKKYGKKHYREMRSRVKK